MANVRNEIATRAAIRFNFVRGVRANRDPCPSYGFVSASRSSACRSSVMNGCTPTFPSNNKLCLLGITLRKWRAPVANPSLESNNRSACPHYARWLARSNFLIEGITRATAYESERGGCLDAQKAEIFTNLYIYIYFWFLNFLFSQRNFVTDWIKVLFRIATLLKRIDSFLQRIFPREVLPLGAWNEFEIARMERGGYTGFESLLRAEVELEFISSISFEVIVDGISFRWRLIGV